MHAPPLYIKYDNTRLGVELREQTSGDAKCGGSAYAPRDPFEEAKTDALLRSIHNEFIACVCAGRGRRLNHTLAHALSDARGRGLFEASGAPGARALLPWSAATAAAAPVAAAPLKAAANASAAARARAQVGRWLPWLGPSLAAKVAEAAAEAEAAAPGVAAASAAAIAAADKRPWRVAWRRRLTKANAAAAAAAAASKSGKKGPPTPPPPLSSLSEAMEATEEEERWLRRGLFDGSVYGGRTAVELGLADGFGDATSHARSR